MEKKHWILLCLSTILLLFAYNGSMFVTDTVESNYALTSKEMVLSGDWTSPQIYGRYWFDKPIMFYWATALAYKMFGFTDFASRFFPSLFGVMSIAFIAWAGRKLYSAKAGFFSAMVLLTSFSFFLIGKSIITDSLLFFFLSGALFSWLLGYEGEHRYYYGTYIFCALATLTKGPIGLLLPGLIITIFLLIERNWQALKHMKLATGTLLFILIATPWYFVMYTIHGSSFLDVFLGTHNYLRATVSEHPNDNVFYYYTLILLLGFFPWTGFLPQLIKDLLYSSKRWQLPASRELFLAIWAATIFIFFQSMATKYITYTFPMLFPISLLLGRYIVSARSTRLTVPITVQVFFYLLIGAGAYWAHSTNEVNLPELWLAATFIAIAFIATLSAFRLQQTNAILLMAVIAFGLHITLLKTVCVPLTSERSAKQMIMAINENFPGKTIYAYGDYPTSAMFYSDQLILKIIDDSSEESFKPKAYSWSSKNIMPYRKFSQLEDHNYVILMKDRFYEYFTRSKPIPIKTQLDADKWCILEY